MSIDEKLTTLEQLVGNGINAAYLQADVCRSDLLVEIEALAFKPMRWGVT